MKVYISGPMTGYEFYNFPAFDEARDALRAGNIEVFSPADHDRAIGFDPMTMDPVSLKKRMLELDLYWHLFRWDFDAVATVDALYVLHGADKSSGANLEVGLAKLLGKLIFYQSDDTYRDVARIILHSVRERQDGLVVV